MDKLVFSDYEDYRRWFELSLDIVWRMSPEMKVNANPMTQIAAAESKSRKAAVLSLASGIKDTVAITDRYSVADLEEADRLFEKEGLPTLSALRSIFAKKVSKIIKLGVINNDDEYYDLKNVLEMEIPESAKNLIAKMVGEYELGKWK